MAVSAKGSRIRVLLLLLRPQSIYHLLLSQPTVSFRHTHSSSTALILRSPTATHPRPVHDPWFGLREFHPHIFAAHLRNVIAREASTTPAPSAACLPTTDLSLTSASRVPTQWRTYCLAAISVRHWLSGASVVVIWNAFNRQGYFIEALYSDISAALISTLEQYTTKVLAQLLHCVANIPAPHLHSLDDQFIPKILDTFAKNTKMAATLDTLVVINAVARLPPGLLMKALLLMQHLSITPTTDTSSVLEEFPVEFTEPTEKEEDTIIAALQNNAISYNNNNNNARHHASLLSLYLHPVFDALQTDQLRLLKPFELANLLRAAAQIPFLDIDFLKRTLSLIPSLHSGSYSLRNIITMLFALSKLIQHLSAYPMCRSASGVSPCVEQWDSLQCITFFQWATAEIVALCEEPHVRNASQDMRRLGSICCQHNADHGQQNTNSQPILTSSDCATICSALLSAKLGIAPQLWACLSRQIMSNACKNQLEPGDLPTILALSAHPSLRICAKSETTKTRGGAPLQFVGDGKLVESRWEFVAQLCQYTLTALPQFQRVSHLTALVSALAFNRINYAPLLQGLSCQFLRLLQDKYAMKSLTLLQISNAIASLSRLETCFILRQTEGSAKPTFACQLLDVLLYHFLSKLSAEMCQLREASLSSQSEKLRQIVSSVAFSLALQCWLDSRTTAALLRTRFVTLSKDWSTIQRESGTEALNWILFLQSGRFYYLRKPALGNHVNGLGCTAFEVLEGIERETRCWTHTKDKCLSLDKTLYSSHTALSSTFSEVEHVTRICLASPQRPEQQMSEQCFDNPKTLSRQMGGIYIQPFELRLVV